MKDYSIITSSGEYSVEVRLDGTGVETYGSCEMLPELQESVF